MCASPSRQIAEVDRRIVLVTWPDFSLEDPQTGGLLTAAGFHLRLAPKTGDRTVAEMCELAADCEGAIVSTDPFTADVISACRALRVISRVGVGVDSIDVDAATDAGVPVTITPGANDATTAEHAIALMLAATRRVIEHDAAVRRGEWLRTGPHTPFQLSGRTVGLVGYGRIGQLVAIRLIAFGARVLVYDPQTSAIPPAQDASFEDLLAAANIISLHAPLLPSTRNLIGEREFALMRPGAILVNTARGGLVDEAAMICQLGAGRLRAAALDVYETEPPPRSVLFEMPNVVMTPHTGGISDRSIREMLLQATTGLLAVLDGDGHGAAIVNPDALTNHRARAARPAPLP